MGDTLELFVIFYIIYLHIVVIISFYMHLHSRSYDN